MRPLRYSPAPSLTMSVHTNGRFSPAQSLTTSKLNGRYSPSPSLTTSQISGLISSSQNSTSPVPYTPSQYTPQVESRVLGISEDTILHEQPNSSIHPRQTTIPMDPILREQSDMLVEPRRTTTSKSLPPLAYRAAQRVAQQMRLVILRSLFFKLIFLN